MSSSFKFVVTLAVLVLAGLAFTRAASFRFGEKQNAMRQGCAEERKKQGLTPGQAKAKYPTPEIRMVSSGCLMPGGTGEVVLKGKFPPGTRLFLENDNLEVVKESATAAEYRATVKVAAGIGPQTAAVVVMSPVSCIMARAGSEIRIGGRYEWDMQVSNGWRVVARPAGNQPCGGPASEQKYETQFFRKGESAPFEKRQATHSHDNYSGADRFSISQDDSAYLPGMADMQRLMQRMSDPKLSDAERNSILQQIEKVQKQLQANMSKLTDPASIKQREEKKKQFDCRWLELKLQGSSFTGELRCAQALGRLQVTGTLKSLGQ